VPVTRDVSVDARRDLLARPRRASVTFIDGDGLTIHVRLVPLDAEVIAPP